MQAATLETLVNLVAAGYGATLIPALAADSLGQRGICAPWLGVRLAPFGWPAAPVSLGLRPCARLRK